MSDGSGGKSSALQRWRRWRMGDLDGPPESLAHELAEIPEPAPDAHWQAELDALRRQVRESARREGYDAGYQAGREAGYQHGLDAGQKAAEELLRQQQRDLMHPLTTLALNMQRALQQMEQDVAEELVTLALTVGRKLAGDALRDTPDQVMHLVRHLMREAPLADSAPTLWLHPEDLQRVRDSLLPELTGAGWLLNADDSLQPGGCRLSSRSGEVDASLETRWALVLGTLRRSPRDTGQDADGQADKNGERA